ncbi:hypothetical protein BH23ACT8_BH23ACT8_03190 [soil metagenome]
MPGSDLVAYTLMARPHRTEDWLRLGYMDGDDNPPSDLFETISPLLTKDETWSTGAGTDEVTCEVSASFNPTDRPRTVYGRVKVGERGERYDVHLADDETTVAVRPLDQRSQQMFFWLTVPERGRRGLLLVERVGNRGIRNRFWDEHLLAGITNAHPGTKVELAHFYPEKVWEEFIDHDGKVAKIRLQKVLLTEDDSKAADDQARFTNHGTLEVSVNRPRLSVARETVAGWFQNGLSTEEAVEVLLPEQEQRDHVAGLEPERIIVEIDLGSHGQRTVVIDRPDRKGRAGYKVTGVDVDDDGYPKVHEMADFAAGLEQDLTAALGWA